MSDSDSDWEEDEEEEAFSQPILTRQKSFEILDQDKVHLKIKSIIEENSETFGLSEDETLILLLHLNWKTYKLQEDFLDNEYKLRVEAGLMKAESDFSLFKGKKIGSLKLVSGTQGLCQICFESIQERDSLTCGQAFCCNCWSGYIEDLVQVGQIIGCSCPYFGCGLKVPESMVMKYASEAAKAKYRKLLSDNFISLNPMFRYCPAPGCSFIAEYSNMSVHEIQCLCGFLFCFACGEESHRPASCEYVKEWNMKNSAESENINWILANTKQCPNCRKPIEKNQGCNHMTCNRDIGGCGFEFCWLCSGNWSEHGSNTGGYYKCNKYDELVAKNETFKNIESQRKSAKTELDKYMWYFERFNNHNKAQILAKEKQLSQIEVKMHQLHDIKQYPIGEVEFLKLAVEQVIRCRRVLKWTYVFGYYLLPGLEKNLFEHLQEKLEENTDRLHELVEKPLDEYLDHEKTDKAPFYHYKSDLTNYSQVTKEFFDRLIIGIENGLTT
jgi:ariadne-1